jgi:hypothetical protein
MYPLLNLAGILKTWQIRYCSGDYQQCERYKRTMLGQPVPPELMPNGTLLKRGSNSALRVVKE